LTTNKAPNVQDNNNPAVAREQTTRRRIKNYDPRPEREEKKEKRRKGKKEEKGKDSKRWCTHKFLGFFAPKQADPWSSLIIIGIFLLELMRTFGSVVGLSVLLSRWTIQAMRSSH
jgi:hypothetical protein